MDIDFGPKWDQRLIMQLDYEILNDGNSSDPMMNIELRMRRDWILAI